MNRIEQNRIEKKTLLPLYIKSTMKWWCLAGPCSIKYERKQNNILLLNIIIISMTRPFWVCNEPSVADTKRSSTVVECFLRLTHKVFVNWQCKGQAAPGSEMLKYLGITYLSSVSMFELKHCFFLSLSA